jgi:hypothetical protein
LQVWWSGILRIFKQLQITEIRIAEYIRTDSGFAASGCDPCVRRVVPVVETGAPVEVVVVAELENWT